MPNIKPISDLRNYTAVLSEDSYGGRVYLNQLLTKLQAAEKSVIEEGTISADELEEELGV